MSRASLETSTRSRRAAALAGRKFFLLFLFLLGVLVLYPYAENSAFGYYAFRVLGGAAILVSAYAVSFRRSLIIFALLLAIPVFLQHVLNFHADAGSLSILSVVFNFVFNVFIVVVIFRRVFSHAEHNAETIFGALCIYLLVGFGFASVYGMIATLQPRAFYLDPLTNLHTVPDRMDFVYYSFGMMTSLGASGITPVSAEARSLSVIEAILGVLYLAVLISRLVGAYRHPGT
jgi:hypothetical protein